MIPWTFFSCLRSEMQRICGVSLFRVMFNKTESPSPALVLGVFFHGPERVTLLLNDAYRNSLQLALVESAKSSVAALVVTDLVSEQRQVVVVWKDPSGAINASIISPASVRDIANYTRNVADQIRRAGGVVEATQGTPAFLLVIKGRGTDGTVHQRAFYTTTCMPSVESQWARAHFLHACPTVDVSTITEGFHTSPNVAHLSALNTPTENWWVYVDGQPRQVPGAEAVGLYRAGKIKHVCRPDQQEWQTLADAGLIKV